MNLIVAKEIPSQSDLDIANYQRLVNEWVSDFTKRCLPRWEPYFHESPHDFENDIRYFRLGMVSQYLEMEIGIEYIEEQRDVNGIFYTNPSDLFLNGVLDTLKGTCGNMAALQLAIGWRLNWPVSLACVNSHFLLRFDDGETIYNIETTQSGHGGFKSDPDDFLIRERNLSPLAISSGSDLRDLKPREILGSFIALRARHIQDVGKSENNEQKMLDAETDWLLARQLFPTSRVLYKNHVALMVMRGETLFAPHEIGHPNSHRQCWDEIRSRRNNDWRIEKTAKNLDDALNLQTIDHIFSSMGTNS